MRIRKTVGIYYSILGVILMVSLIISSSIAEESVLTYDNVRTYYKLQDLQKYGLEPDSVITDLYISPDGIAMFIAQRMKGKDALYIKLNLNTGKVSVLQLRDLKRISKTAYKGNGQEAMFYSLFGTKFFYVYHDKMYTVEDPVYTLFIPGDAPFLWLTDTPYILTIAGFRKRDGSTDGKLYLTLIEPKAQNRKFRKIIDINEFITEASAEVNQNPRDLKLRGLSGYSNYILSILGGPEGDYLCIYDYTRSSFKRCFNFSRIAQYSVYGNNMLILCHKPKEETSTIYLLLIDRDSLDKVDTGKLILPMLSDNRLSYIKFKGGDMYLIDALISNPQVKQEYKIGFEARSGYWRVLNDGRIVFNDNTGFIVW